MQVNLDESAPIFGDAIEHFATNCMSLHKGMVFAIEKILLHQFFVVAVAKMVDAARSLSAGQHNIFFVGFFNCQWLHKIFFGLFFWLDASFLMHSTFGIMKLVQRERVGKFHRMCDFEWWRSVVTELVTKDGKNV